MPWVKFLRREKLQGYGTFAAGEERDLPEEAANLAIQAGSAIPFQPTCLNIPDKDSMVLLKFSI